MKSPKAPLSKGFSLVEVILSIALFATISMMIMGTIIYTRDSNIATSNLGRGSELAAEGIEIAKDIRNQNFTLLTDGNHGVNIVSNKYAFNGTSQNIGEFTRTINVSSTGQDAYTRKITSTVTWQNRVGGQRSTSVEALVTDWRRTIINDWTTPTIQTVTDITSSTVNAVDVIADGNYVYLLMANGLRIYNVSNPLTTVFTGSIALAATPSRMDKAGNYVYIASSANNAEFQIINVTNPSAPTSAAIVDLSGSSNATAVKIIGNYAYITRTVGTNLYVYNITTPTSPSSVTSVNLADDNPLTINSLNNYLFIGASGNSTELMIYNVAVPASPVSLWTVNASGNQDLLSIEVSGNYLLLGRSLGIIDFYNISALPAVPTNIPAALISLLPSSQNIAKLDVYNQYLFIATNNSTNNFRVYDLSTLPVAPTAMGILSPLPTLSGVAYHAPTNRAFVSSGSDTGELTTINPN